MEHRWHQRNPVRLDMIAQSGTLGSICGRTRNISHGGILFDTGSVSLAPRAIVKLSCCLLVEEEWRFYAVRAQVVYADKGCAGLMFLDHEAAYAKFEAVLKSVISSSHSKEVLNADSILPCFGCGRGCECGCEDILTTTSKKAAG